MDLRELTKAAELEWAFPVLRELRPHLTFDEFRRIYDKARAADGYALIGAFDGDECVAVMGCRILHDLVHGSHLYVDDLVATKARRSQGLGAKLLKHAEGLARQQGLAGLRLCTGIENGAGKRFYEREGWHLRAVAYKKRLDG